MQDDGTVSVDVEVASAGMYKLTIYAYGVGGSKVQNLAINGVDQAQISIPEGEFAPISTTAKLTAGKNTAYDQIMDAVSDFDMVNAKLAAILEELNMEELFLTD